MDNSASRWGWTEKRRKQQAANARKIEPWRESSGPKTAEGKAAMRFNAVKHGLLTPEGKALKRTLKALKKTLKS